MNIEEKSIGEIKGNFKIEAYQRGYRWTSQEVKRLLDDIMEFGGERYCLQPIVVKPTETHYELIDGQQRLTTLYLINQYLHHISCMRPPSYTMEYTTRIHDEKHIGSQELLENINKVDIDIPPTYIDELFIKQAYRTIKDYFRNPDTGEGDWDKGAEFANKLKSHVSVIWYEVDDENPTEIFTRLNIGKISLTNAELVKALFLSRGQKDKNGSYAKNQSGLDAKRQHEIALLWDQMEKGLRDEKFWAFITNEKPSLYPTRMELLFDLIENKDEQNSENSKYFTFFRFYERFKDRKNKYSTWEETVRDYQQLQEWYKDFNLYHMIGYLVTCGWKISQLLDLAKGKGEGQNGKAPLKSEFKDIVVSKIRESMAFTTKENGRTIELNYEDLTYETHYEKIKQLLLLFNVETIRQKGDSGNRFPFVRYKNEGWSLEHIHAQNSESLKTNQEWKDWLLSHQSALKTLQKSFPQLSQAIESVLSEEEPVLSIKTLLARIDSPTYHGSIREDFKIVSEKVIRLLSDDTDGEGISQMHSLSNMALLSGPCNSALRNATFDVKRFRIIEMDRHGEYIPQCTRNVFLKYYSDSDTKIHFWSHSDRESYIQAINDVLFSRKDIQGNEKTLNLLTQRINYGRQ
ncbi:MAG: DUF262 domain-containing protein [Bacteroidales bacterium]|nr:DUF262 domain-containing protein [Bacteroidales bacterium]